MRHKHFLILAIACSWVAATTLPAQSLVNKLENKAKARSGNAAAEPAVAEKGYLGLGSADDTPSPGNGVILSGVKKGAPGDLGGLRDGDVVTFINGKPCRTVAELDAMLDQSTVGTKLTMTVMRGGKQETKIVTLGRRPADPPASEEPAAPPTTSPPATSPPSLTSPSPELPSTAPAGNVPADPLAERPPAEPTLAPPLSSPLRAVPAEPAASAPSLRSEADAATPPPSLTPPAADPLAAPADPLARPDRQEPSLELPAPPSGIEPAGDPLAPAVDRRGSEIPPPSAGATGRASLGISVVPLSDETRTQYDVRSSARQGAIIVAIRPGSAADAAGLPLGAVIVSIDGRIVRSSDDLVETISAGRPGQEVELRYYHGERLATKSVRLAPASSTGSVATLPPAATPRTPPGAAADRPLMRRFENMVEALGPDSPRTTVGSTILDPSRVAEMYEELKTLRETVTSLEDRIKLLEAKLGGQAPAVNP